MTTFRHPGISLLSIVYLSSLFAADHEWIDLFDGKSLDRWVANLGKRGDDKSQQLDEIFTVNEGTLHIYRDAPNRTKQFNANIRTKEKFSSFHLQAEWAEQQYRTVRIKKL